MPLENDKICLVYILQLVVWIIWILHRILKKYQFYEKVTHKNDEVEKDSKTEGERERVERERERERSTI